MNYYNEHDPKAAAWLRELIRAGEIPPGHVDERDIQNVKPTELAGYTQCHFFAGIGGWPLALRLAEWPDTEPVWTGSCPCQPFSCAGEGMGESDERHLWPDFRNLIGNKKPPVVFGEQVASKSGLQWLDGVCADMERAGYAIGTADLCAAGFGAPHIRQRLYFVAERVGVAQGDCDESRRDDAHAARPASAAGESGELADAECNGRRSWRTKLSGLGGRIAPFGAGTPDGHPGPTNGHWRAADWLLCRDGKWRPVEPGTFPLAHGVSGRVGLLRGYGNAIVPQVAAKFIQAWCESVFR